MKDYKVTHNFESIGKKTILLNAKQIDSVQLIILAMEDITVRQRLEVEVVKYTKTLETKIARRTKDLSNRVKELERINKIMVDRELKMIELKSELEEIKKSRKS